MMTQKFFFVSILIMTSLLFSACNSVVSAAGLPAPFTQTTPGQNLIPFQCLASITPGKTNRAEVIGVMGEPVNKRIEEGNEVLEYPSSIEIIPTTILVKQDIVHMVGKLADDETQTISKFNIDMGEPEKVTYSYFGQGTMTYLYPKKGLAAIAEEESGQVLWLQCFIPMPLKDYLKDWGSQLPLEDPYIR